MSSATASRLGLLASPREETLWELAARAVLATGDAAAAERLWRAMAANLGAETAGRLRGALAG